MKIWQLKQLSKLLYICATLVFTKSHAYTQIMSLQRILWAQEISGQTEKFQDREKLTSHPWGKIYMQTTEY